MLLHNEECFKAHMGIYCVEPNFFSSAFSAIKTGLWKPLSKHKAATEPPGRKRVIDPLTASWDVPETLYLVENSIGILSIVGPMMKFDSKFGGANTLRARRAVRSMNQDNEVEEILLYLDSPGGSTAGTFELAGELAASKKPVHAHIEDLAASAGYWAASQARRITANPTAMVGSIGTFAVLEDTSKAAEMAGVKVHVVSTGDLKGAGADGSPLTEEYLKEVQKLVNETNAFFLEAIQAGRKMDKKDVKALATGQIWMAAEAKKLGLIDAVETFDSVISGLGEKLKQKRKLRSEQNRLGLSLRIQEAE